MEEKAQSKGSQHIEQLMQQLPPDSERYRVLASAKQFKSSWVELGEWLARVSGGSHYTQWGYTSFQDYCTREIRIRRQTAEKLLLAYRFLERREPGLLDKQERRALPDYRSVDLLRKADEGGHFSMAEYSELRQAVVDEERSHPVVAKRFRDMAQSHRPETIAAERCKGALAAARRLATSLDELDEVPLELTAPLAKLVDYLQQRLEEERAALEAPVESGDEG